MRRAIFPALLVGACRTTTAPSTAPERPEASTPAADPDVPALELAIRRGGAVEIDGRNAPGEWDDAGTTMLAASATTIRYKHDGTHLLFAFTGLGAPGAFRYPEILLDLAADGGMTWGPDDWWFHASFRDCWSHGRYNDYDSCVDAAPSWAASNYTDEHVAPAVIEVALPLATLGVAPGARVGLAFIATDTRRTWTMWPATAQLAIPATWAAARIE